MDGENGNRGEKQGNENVVDLHNNSDEEVVAGTEETNQQLKLRKRLFCLDIVTEAVKFLHLQDLLRTSAINHWILGGPCQRAIDHLKPPRIVGPLRIDSRGIHREQLLNGQRILEPLALPEVPLPSEKILGFERIKVNLRTIPTGLDVTSIKFSSEFLELIATFLRMIERYLRQHDLLVDFSVYLWQEGGVEVLAERIFSQLVGGVRLIEMDTGSMILHRPLLESQAFRNTNRLLYLYQIDPLWDDTTHSHYFVNPNFDGCVDWLHFPTIDEAPRTLILCLRGYSPGFELRDCDEDILLLHLRHEHREGKNFCLIHLYLHPPPRYLKPYYMCDLEANTALRMEPIRNGRDRFGRPLSGLFSVDPMLLSQYENASQAIEGFLKRTLCRVFFPPSAGNYTDNTNGYILRRDVAIGPWTRPELFEARRGHQSLIHFKYPYRDKV